MHPFIKNITFTGGYFFQLKNIFEILQLKKKFSPTVHINGAKSPGTVQVLN